MCSLDSGSEGEEAGRTREAHSSEHVSEDEALVEVMLPRIPLSCCELVGINPELYIPETLRVTIGE